MAKKRQNISDEIIDRIVTGRPAMYKGIEHIYLLLELFRLGKEVSSFCAAAAVCRKTFYIWLERYPEFKRAYEIAVEFAEAVWQAKMEEGINDPSFNNTGWSMVMRNRFGYTEHRKIKLDALKEANDYLNQYKAIIKSVSEGLITAVEANHLASLITVGVRVDELTTMKADVELLKERFLK